MGGPGSQTTRGTLVGWRRPPERPPERSLGVVVAAAIRRAIASVPAVALFGLLSACGGTEATSTLTPAPAARTEVELTVVAVPAPTGTSIPGVTATPRAAPEPRATAASGPTIAGFDHARFQREVLNMQPEAIRVSANIPSPTGAGTAETEFSIRTGDDAVRMLIVIDAEDVRLEIELVVIGPRTYLRGQSGDTIVDWMATTNSESANPLADLGLGGAQAFDIARLDEPWRAVAVQPCGQGRRCFVLEIEGAAGDRLSIDTGTYAPVRFVTAGEGGEGATDVRIEWNADVQIAPPADAREVSEEEFGLAFIGLIFAALPAEGPIVP